MALIYQQLDYTIAAGEFAEVNIPARTFVILSNTGAEDSLALEFISPKQQKTPIKKGLTLEIPQAAFQQNQTPRGASPPLQFRLCREP